MPPSEGPRPALAAFQRVAIRTGRGPLGKLWALGFGAIQRWLPVYLLRGREGSAYVRGGTAHDQPLWGASDIDLYCVVREDPAGAGIAQRAVIERWSRLRRRLPFVSVWVYEDAGLAAECSDSYLTHGLDAARDAPLQERAMFYDGHPGAGAFGLQGRPGLFGPLADWRLVQGAERRPPAPPQDRDRVWISTWIELQWWWMFAFRRSLDPTHPTTSYLAAKLIVEPVRMLLWLEDGRRVWRRPELISIGLERYPAQREGLLLARDLIERPLGPGGRGREADHRRALAAALPHFISLSRAVTERIDREIEGERIAVRLIGIEDSPLPAPGSDQGGSAEETLPLCDWRVLCAQSWPDAALLPRDADLTPESIAACLTDSAPSRLPVLGAGGGLWVMPEPVPVLRRIAGPFSDPVSSALLADSSSARFAPAAGFSAGDWARRAVAERGAQLAVGEADHSADRIGLLLAGARAGLFAESLAEGEPGLTLTAAASATELARRFSRRASAIAQCYDTLATGGDSPGAAAGRELERAVSDLLNEAGSRLSSGSERRSKPAGMS